MGVAARFWQGGPRRGAGLVVASLAFVAVSFVATGGPVPLAVERSPGGTVLRPPAEGDGPPPATTPVDEPVAEPVDSTRADIVGLLIQIAVIVSIAGVILVLGRAR